MSLILTAVCAHCSVLLCLDVAQDRTVKVADLGESRELYESCTPEDLPSPALNWAPPEVSIPAFLTCAVYIFCCFVSSFLGIFLCCVQMLNPVLEERCYSMSSDVYGVAMVLSEVNIVILN